MYFLVTFSILLILVNAIPDQKSFGPRIYDGKNASIEWFPYQVSVESFGHQTCGGSILNAHWIVTAAHCTLLDFKVRNAEYFTVRSGSSLKEQGGRLHHVEKMLLHPDFGHTEKRIPVNDIALFRVKEPFVFGKTCQPVKLFEAREKVSSGIMANVTGWGKTRTGYLDNLYFVEVPVIDTGLCDEAYRIVLGGVPTGYICASYYGEGGRNACTGDSGGPMTVGGRLAGIVSWSYRCAEPYYPTVYTDVAYFRDWIDKHVESSFINLA